LEEEVRGFGFEGDVADFVDDEQRCSPEPAELVVEAALGVGVAEACDPFGGGRERDGVTGLACSDRDADGEVGFPGAGRPEEDDVVACVDEVECAEVRDDVALEGALVVEVEVFEGLAGREPCGADAASPPWSWRAATSRSRQAARNSSCVQLSVRARSASRSNAAASDGAFSARHR
jgi:hypothetical protein